MSPATRRAHAAIALFTAVLLAAGCGEGASEPAPQPEPSEGGGGTLAREVRISEAALRRANIRIEEARRMAMTGGIRVPAEVQLPPDQVVHVAPIVSGQLVSVRGSVGQHVEPGDVLAELRSVELGTSRAQVQEAQAAVEVAQANYERQRQLVDEGIGARRNLIEAEGALRTARAQLSGAAGQARVYGQGGRGATTELTSTIAGEVVQRHATVGEIVEPGTTLFVIANPRPVWVVGNVYPQDANEVRAGMPATLTIRDLPERTWEAPLAWVSPVLDEETRTLPVRIELPNDDGALRPGSFGTIHLARRGAEPVVTVASTALVEVHGADVLFVPTDTPGRFLVQPVTVGERGDPRVEIIDGLDAGQRYVAQGAFVLKSQLLRGELGEGD